MTGAIGRFRGAQGAFEGRRQSIAQVDDFLIKNTSVSGRILVVGAGEVVVEIGFPVWFTERPNFTFGGELEDGQFIEAELFPTISGIVEKWTRNKTENANGGYFIGANIICVTTGKPDQRIYLHWRMEGKAMSNPSVSEE